MNDFLDSTADAAGIIGQYQQFEAARRQWDERYSNLFDLCRVAVYSCSASGVIQDYNNRAAELWGRSPEHGDTDERFCGSFKLYRPDGRFMPHEQCPMADVLSGKIPGAYDAEVVIGRPDGSQVIVLVNIAPIMNQHGEVTGAINCFYDISERKKYEQAARESAQRSLVLEQIFLAQEEERKRIACELHDEAGQLLTSLLVGLKRLESSKNLKDCKAIAQQAREIATLALDELRRLARGLHPAVLVDLGLSAAIGGFLQQYQDRYGIRVKLASDELDSNQLSGTVQIAIYRIVQEALTNVARHARAKSVSVTLKHSANAVEVSVIDDGCGLDLSSLNEVSRDHLGLRSIRERAALLGGVALITSGEKGTQVIAHIPLHESDES